jgi:hypothetical protein
VTDEAGHLAEMCFWAMTTAFGALVAALVALVRTRRNNGRHVD